MTARDSPSDATLIMAAQTDPEAFTAVFERHARAVHGFLARRAGHHVADDLLGEVFATAFDARRRYDPEFLSAVVPEMAVAVGLALRGVAA